MMLLVLEVSDEIVIGFFSAVILGMTGAIWSIVEAHG